MTTRRRRPRGLPGGLLAVLALALGTLAGCSGHKPPAVTLSAVRVAETTDEAVALECDLALVNPNATETIPLDEVRYTLAIDGVVTYRGRHASLATLSPGERRLLSVPVVVPRPLLARDGGVDYTLDGTIRYRAPSQFARLLFDIKVRRPKTRFRGSGSLVVGDQ